MNEQIELAKAKYGNNKNKLMTAAVLNCLRTNYPEKNEEYKLIYRKAEKYLEK